MARNSQEDLMLLSKETLVALLIAAVDNGNKIEMQLRTLEADKNVSTAEKLIDDACHFLAKDNAIGVQDDLTQIVFDGLEPKSEEWVGKFRNLDINPAIDGAPDNPLTEEQLLRALKVQSNLTMQDFEDLHLGRGDVQSRFRIFAANGWNLLSFMFNQCTDKERASIIAKLNTNE